MEEQHNNYIGISSNQSYFKVIVYTCVSIRSQTDDLKYQVNFVRTFVSARDIGIDDYIEDVGEGWDYDRPM